MGSWYSTFMQWARDRLLCDSHTDSQHKLYWGEEFLHVFFVYYDATAAQYMHFPSSMSISHCGRLALDLWSYPCILINYRKTRKLVYSYLEAFICVCFQSIARVATLKISSDLGCFAYTWSVNVVVKKARRHGCEIKAKHLIWGFLHLNSSGPLASWNPCARPLHEMLHLSHSHIVLLHYPWNFNNFNSKSVTKCARQSRRLKQMLLA